MSQASEDIQRLLLAHFQGDENTFRAAAWDFVKRERSLNHNVLADELERILSQGGAGPAPQKAFFSVLAPNNGNIPKDKDKNASLIELSEPRRELSDLVLSPELQQEMGRVIREYRNKDLLYSHGMRPMGKLLFCGPPGCGKTVAAHVLAKELYLPLATVRFDAVVSSYLGETAANLRKVFDFARTRPMVLFFDEFDAIGKHRTAYDEHGELKRVVNSFLQLLDGFQAETLTVAATNHEGLLDPALWRRFDDILFFTRPTPEQIELLLARYFRQLPVTPLSGLRTLSRSLEGFAHADVERLAQDAIKETLIAGQDKITTDVLNTAVARQKARMAVTQAAAASESPPPKKESSRRPRKNR